MKKYLVIVAMLGTLLLVGCSSTTEGKVSKVLADMHEIENTYKESQQELQSLEQEEQTLFNDTMALTPEDQSEVTQHVEKLKELLNARSEKILGEEDAMNEAKELVVEFDKIEEKLGADEKSQVEKLKEAIVQRYETHTLFVTAYKELMDAQKNLYDMLINEETNALVLNEQVDLVNEQNGEVVTVIEVFNEQTIALNEVRDEVYGFLEKNKE